MNKVAVSHAANNTLRQQLATVSGRLDAVVNGIDAVLAELRRQYYGALQHADAAARAGRYSHRANWQGYAGGLEQGCTAVEELIVRTNKLLRPSSVPPREEANDA